MNRIKEWILLTLLCAGAGSANAQVYPSANTAWVIPGGHTAPTSTDYQSQFPTAELVREWELQHADLILGGKPGALPVSGNNQSAPYVKGWTVQPDHAGFLIYQTPPYDKPVWEHHQQDGGLYVYLHRSVDEVVSGGPEEMILARKYTKGLILYRTDFFGHSPDFQQSVSE